MPDALVVPDVGQGPTNVIANGRGQRLQPRRPRLLPGRAAQQEHADVIFRRPQRYDQKRAGLLHPHLLSQIMQLAGPNAIRQQFDRFRLLQRQTESGPIIEVQGPRMWPDRRLPPAQGLTHEGAQSQPLGLLALPHRQADKGHCRHLCNQVGGGRHSALQVRRIDDTSRELERLGQPMSRRRVGLLKRKQAA